MRYKFYPNSKDGNHCVQACIQTLLDHFNVPVPTLYELDRITNHRPGRYTWMSATLLWLAEQGFKVMHVENIDYRQFAEHGSSYLADIYSNEVFELQDKMSDLKQEQIYASRLISTAGIELMNDRWSISKIKPFLERGYVALVSINPFVLDGKSDLIGSHLVVVTRISLPSETENPNVTVCDPDIGWRIVPYEEFERAVQKDDFSMTFLLYPANKKTEG